MKILKIWIGRINTCRLRGKLRKEVRNAPTLCVSIKVKLYP